MQACSTEFVSRLGVDQCSSIGTMVSIELDKPSTPSKLLCGARVAATSIGTAVNTESASKNLLVSAERRRFEADEKSEGYDIEMLAPFCGF